MLAIARAVCEYVGWRSLRMHASHVGARPETSETLVQFARGVHDGQDYAIKFFTVREAFEREDALYSNKTLRDMMPAVRLPAPTCKPL